MCSNTKIHYNEIININNLQIALNHLKNKNFPALDGELKSSVSHDLLKKLHKELKQQKYSPKPSKRIPIEKPNRGRRYLAFSSTRDKIVQAAIVEKLQPTLEQYFLNCSFGFRPQRNCHNALKVIRYQWQNLTWLIKIDIEKTFDKIQHKILLEKLKTFCDQSTLELITKLINVGYIDIHNLNDPNRYNKVDVPLGSILSPLLCNLYFHDLDVYVTNQLLSQWNFGHQLQVCQGLKGLNFRKELTDDDRKLVAHYPELIDQIQRIKHNRSVLSSSTNHASFRRFHYIRYADDILMGFTGTKKEANSILQSIQQFFNSLKLNLNNDTTTIYHSGDKGCLYLGMYIRYIHHNKPVLNPSTKFDENGIPDKKIPQLKSISLNTCQLRVPIERLLNRAVSRKHATVTKTGTIRATSNRALTSLSEQQIVQYYSRIIKGILNYYSCVNRKSDLWSIVSLYRKTCALTLADKLKLRTASKVFSQFGPRLRITNNLGKDIAQLYYPESLKTKIDFKITRNDISEINLCVSPDYLEGSHK